MEVHFCLFGGDFVISSKDEDLVRQLSKLAVTIDVFHEVLPHRKREIDDFVIALIRDLQFMYEAKNKNK